MKEKKTQNSTSAGIVTYSKNRWTYFKGSDD